MPILVLSEYDQQRYSVPAQVEYESGMFGRKAVAELKSQTGYTLARISAGANGIPRMVDGVEVIERDDVALVAFAWVILRDAGHKIPWDEFDLHGPVDFAYGEEDEEEGKADTSNTTTTQTRD
jgi:hypothetical protein